MTLEQVMDLQYRKLLTAKDVIWQEMGPIWDDEDADAMGFAPNMYVVGILLLVDMDTMGLPELNETQRDMIEPLYEEILNCEDNSTGISLPLEYRKMLLKVLETNRICDQWNRELALKVTDFVNEAFPSFYVGKEHLAEIL